MKFFNFIVLAIILIMAACTIVVEASAVTPKAVSISNYHSLILMDDGTVWGMGNADRGELGSNVSITSGVPQSYLIVVPVRVEGISNVKQIAAGDGFSMALRNDGTVWTWGDNCNGKLGIGDYDNTSTPMQVPGLEDIVAIDAYHENAMALCNDGSVWIWGSNLEGQIPNYSEDICKLPYRIQGALKLKAIAVGLLLDTDGTVWELRNNGMYRVGDSTLTHVKAIDAGNDYKLALKDDGTVWAWGSNHYGQLGNGNTEHSFTTPVEVKELANIKSISAGDYHNIALEDDGTVWAWGMNSYGELGIKVADQAKQQVPVILPNSSTPTYMPIPVNDYRATPIQVPGLSKIRAISAGGGSSIVISDDNTIWGWGNNWKGQLGDMPENPNDLVNPSIKDYPVMIQFSSTGNAGCVIPSQDTSPTIAPGNVTISPIADNNLKLNITQLLVIALLLVIVLGAAGYYFVLKKR